MLGPLLDVQMSFCVAGAGDSAGCQKWANREGFVAISTTTATTLHCTTLRYTPRHYQYHYNYNYNYITLHDTNYIRLRYLHYITIRYTRLTITTATTTTTLLYTTLPYIRLH